MKYVNTFMHERLKSPNIALFIGSGCSVGSVPLMGETIKTILENKKIKERIIEYFDKGDIKNFYDIEGFLSWLQNGIKFTKDETLKDELNNIMATTKENFIATIPKFKDKDYLESKVLNNYISFYNKVFSMRSITKSKINIFTTNYDLFSEYALEANNINYTTGFSNGISNEFDIKQFKYRQIDDTDRYKDKWQLVQHEANLLKLHGSINWTQDNTGKLTSENSTKNNYVIYPTELKHKETSQSPYSELFREFNNTLQQQNTTLIIIGYGFPDDHINNLIEQNLKNIDFNLVIFSDHSEKSARKFLEKHSSKSNLHFFCGTINDCKIHHFEYIINNFLTQGKLNG